MQRSPCLVALALLASMSLVGPHSFRCADPSPVPASASGLALTVSLSTSGSTLLMRHCGSCHRSGRANIDLDAPVEQSSLRRDRAMWESVLSMLRSREMPPAGRPQPSPDERGHLIRWIEEGLAQGRAEPTPTGGILARRLSQTEYRNTLRDLLGIPFQPGENFPRDDLNWDRFDGLPSLPALLLKQYQAAADRVVNEVIGTNLPGSASSLQRFFFSQAPSETNRQNVRAALAAFARRAYRRPLHPDEIEALWTAFESAASDALDLEEPIKVVLKSVLTSPHFLYLIEIQEDAADPRNVPGQDQYALASRLSYLLWSSMPDEELLMQAERRWLPRNLEKQVQRMLKDPRSAPWSRASPVTGSAWGSWRA